METKFYQNNFVEKFFFKKKYFSLDKVLLQLIFSKFFLAKNRINKKYILGMYKEITLPIESSLIEKLKK